MKIKIQTIPHKNQRYNTCGDYFEKDGTIHVQVSEMGNEYHELAIAIHELIEAFLAKKRGIIWEDIDTFDTSFDYSKEYEPGDDPIAPYYKEHRFAENIERQLIHELGLDWFIHNKLVNSL